MSQQEELNASTRKVDGLREALSIEEFLAFTDTRPGDERWALIDGEPVLSPSPTDVHQQIVSSLNGYLWRFKIERGAPWFVMPGTGVKRPRSNRNLLQPDQFVKEAPAVGATVSDEAMVIFEVISRSNTRKDRGRRQHHFSRVPNCRHYVVVSTRRPEVMVYDRAADWKSRTVRGLDGSLDLPALGVSLPLADIYRWTPLGAAD